ncbi:MAG: hypothetical protein K2M19_04250 [Muribaculaceae bacterium]|nr:hypothetical protein [Muribaculaceae bacterium]
MNDLVKDSLAGGITAAASLSGNQIITIATAIGAPAISSVAVDFASRTLSKWQSSRLVKGVQMIAEKIGLHNQSGKTFRMDGEMSPINGEEAQQVLEGILQNISDEYEMKKIEAHASLFTNLCFDERIVFEQAMYLTRVLKQLSYRQLIIIAISYDTPLQAGGWQVKFKDSGKPILKNYADLHSEIQQLEQLRILEDSSRGVTLGGSLAPLRLSLFGKTIFEELDLESISGEDKKPVLQMISNVNNA